MATRTIDKTKILARPPFTITFKDDVPADIVSIYVAGGDALTLTPELKTVETELSDAAELDDIVGLRGLVEYNFEEFDQTDIDSINSDTDSVEIATSKGGANGTGKTITFDSLDHCRAMPAEGWGTRVEIKKVVTGTDLNTLMSNLYSISDNAA